MFTEADIADAATTEKQNRWFHVFRCVFLLSATKPKPCHAYFVRIKSFENLFETMKLTIESLWLIERASVSGLDMKFDFS